MTFCKRTFHLLSLLLSTAPHRRHMSQNSNNKRTLFDTLKLVRDLESKGVPTKKAEPITSAIIHILKDGFENAHSFVPKSEMQKSKLLNELRLTKFKSEMQSSKEHHLRMLRHESEKLHSDLEKMVTELRNEGVKSTAELRLEIQKLRALQTTAKYDVIKYLVGTFGVCVAVILMFL